MIVALGVDSQIRGVAQNLGGLFGGAPRGEQAQHASATGLGQSEDLIERRLGDFPPRSGQMRGCVKDALAGIVERSTHVHAIPLATGQRQPQGTGHRFETSAQGQGGRGQDCGAIIEQ